jgi:outer membrane receptor for ferrienterochelin and colicins
LKEAQLSQSNLNTKKTHESGTIVITGTEAGISQRSAGQTEVITAKSIENKNAANLYQALEGIPGIRVENQCQACNFTMIRMQGLGAEHTQVLIDGQPMYSGLAGVYGLQQFTTVDVDKIEVIKGAGRPCTAVQWAGY